MSAAVRTAIMSRLYQAVEADYPGDYLRQTAQSSILNTWSATWLPSRPGRPEPSRRLQAEFRRRDERAVR